MSEHWFKPGDLVTRDGTDIHRVIETNEHPDRAFRPDGMEVECVKAPKDGWCKVGDREFNMCRRYDYAAPCLDGEAIIIAGEITFEGENEP